VIDFFYLVCYEIFFVTNEKTGMPVAITLLTSFTAQAPLP